MFFNVDLRLQMLMERSLLAIASLMVFQIFEALYINCELGSGVVRKASFLFDSKYKEYKHPTIDTIFADGTFKSSPHSSLKSGSSEPELSPPTILSQTGGTYCNYKASNSY